VIIPDRSIRIIFDLSGLTEIDGVWGVSTILTISAGGSWYFNASCAEALNNTITDAERTDKIFLTIVNNLIVNFKLFKDINLNISLYVV
jgi:hypothetical protein